MRQYSKARCCLHSSSTCMVDQGSRVPWSAHRAVSLRIRLVRFALEEARVDPGWVVAWGPWSITAGQVLCVPMLIAGGGLLFHAWRHGVRSAFAPGRGIGAPAQTRAPQQSAVMAPRWTRRVHALLGSAVGWARHCAVVEPISVALAESIRQAFHPRLPWIAFSRLCALPGSTMELEGLRFDLGDVSSTAGRPMSPAAGDGGRRRAESGGARPSRGRYPCGCLLHPGTRRFMSGAPQPMTVAERKRP